MLPEGEPFPGETIRSDGWEYRDFPRMTPENFDKIVDIIGSDNIRWLALADYGKSKRGQCFISPVGFERLKAHSKSLQQR